MIIVSSEITEAIANIPTTRSHTDLRSFCGLVNQLAFSTKDIAAVLAPPILSPQNDFMWTSAHEEAFKQAKKVLTTSPTLSYFDVTKETCLHTDVSTLRIIFVLLQKFIGSGDSEWNMVQARQDPDSSLM